MTIFCHKNQLISKYIVVYNQHSKFFYSFLIATLWLFSIDTIIPKCTL